MWTDSSSPLSLLDRTDWAVAPMPKMTNTNVPAWHSLVVSASIDVVCLPKVSAKNCLHKLHLELIGVMMISCLTAPHSSLHSTWWWLLWCVPAQAPAQMTTLALTGWTSVAFLCWGLWGRPQSPLVSRTTITEQTFIFSLTDKKIQFIVKVLLSSG